MEAQAQKYYRNLRLDPFQQEAIAAIEANQSVLVSAPTGSGKTLIADYAVERTLRLGKQCVFTAPLKALSNQKYRDYTNLLGSDQVGIMTGDVAINVTAPFLIMTTEVLLNLLHREMRRVENLGCVIFDEMHYLANEDRGTVWEETLVLLPPEIPLVGLSATIENIDEITEWLRSIKTTGIVSIKHATRPVPLRVMGYANETGLMAPAKLEKYRSQQIEEFKKTPEYQRLREEERRNDGRRRGRKGRGRRDDRRRGRRRGNIYQNLFQETSHVDMIDFLDKEDLLPCLFFVFSRRKCELMAQDLGHRSFLSTAERQEVRKYLDQRLKEHEAYAAVQRIRRLLLQGIGYHHAGLFPFIKEVVETLYEKRLIKVLYCTSTFALGVNFPARTACFQSVYKFDGRQTRLLTPLEFFQKAGRAGRRGIDDTGYVILRRSLPSAEQLPDYRESDIQPILSALNLSYNSTVNLLETYSLDRIERLLRESFWQYQKRLLIQDLREEADHTISELLKIDGVEVLDDPETVQERLAGLRSEIGAIERKIHSLEQEKGDSAARDLRKQKDVLKNLERRERSIRGLQKVVRHRGGQGRKKVPKLRKRLQRISEEVFELENYLMRTFRGRCLVLEKLGFLNEDYSFNNGAHLVKHLHIQELLVAELVLSGILEELDLPHMSALLCCVGRSEKRRHDGGFSPVPISKPHLREIRKILRKLRDAGAERVEAIEINFDYAIVGYMWSQGASFAELMEVSALDEGDIISCFRQTIDLMKQLKDVYRQDVKMIEFLNTCIDGLDRDVVRVVL